MANKPVIPFFSVRADYDLALKQYINAATMLCASVDAAIKLAEDGADPMTALRTIKKHRDDFRDAAYGHES